MKKRILSFLLCIAMCLTFLPTAAFADDRTLEPDGYELTKDISSLITRLELVGVEQDEDGAYLVRANQDYSIYFSFAENETTEMDMSDYVYFQLPRGVDAENVINDIQIGVFDGFYKSITHECRVFNDVLKIFWNTQSAFFEDLAHAHFVTFDFSMRVTFDGSEDEIRFGSNNDIVIKVDNTGSLTVTKDITGLKSDVNMTDNQKQDMQFGVYDADNNLVRTFRYSDMTNGAITFDGLPPKYYKVVETSHPDFNNYTFDEYDSVTSADGTLTYGGHLNLSLRNDYEYDKGNLELNKTVNVTNWDDSTNVPDSIKNNISFTITGPYGYHRIVSYKDFTDGKMVLTGLEVGEYTITETNSVTGYTWTYKVNNENSGSPTAKAIVAKDETASASFDNTYVQHKGNLTIRKTFSGANVPADTVFTVQFPDGHTVNFKYSDMANDSYTLRNVPIGTYRITENKESAAVENYSLNVTGTGTAEILNNGEDKAITIQNTYTPLGSLKIDKTIAGALSASNLTAAQKKAIKFTVKNSSNQTVKTITYADILSGNNIISGLPVGTYKIQENASTIPGYTMQTEPSSTTVTVTVTSNDIATASFKNTYTKDEYRVTVNKVFNENSFYNGNNLPDEIKNNTTFSISKDGNIIKSCTYAELSSELNNLVFSDPGPYTITENNPNLDGISVTAMVSVDGGSNFTNGNSTTVTLANHAPVTVTFKNAYELQGMIKGDKTVIGLPPYEESELRNNIRFSIYRDNGSTATLYRENVKIAELVSGIIVPAGNYYVQEAGSVGVSGYGNPSVKTQVESGTVKDNLLFEQAYTETFSVERSSTVTVHFTNTYTLGEKGSVNLVKYVKGLDEIQGNDFVILTQALNVKNQNDTILYDGIRFKVEEQRTDNVWYEFGTYSLESLLNGGIQLRPGHYRLTELYSDVPGYAVHADFLIKSSGVADIEQKNSSQVELTINDKQIFNVEVYNVYTKLGNLEISKKIAGDLITDYNSNLGENTRKSVVFEVTGPFGFYDTFTFNDICDRTYRSGKKVYSNIPIGEYTIKEIAGNTTNYNLTTSITVNGSATTPVNGAVKVDVPVGQTAVKVEYTNSYNRKLGSLEIIKTLEGDVPTALTEEQKKAMVFSVIRNNNVVYSITYNEFVDGKYNFTGVPTGDYYVYETISDTLTDSYVITIDGNNQKVTVKDKQSSSVSVTNNFSVSGTLRLVKDFAGCEIPDEKKNTLQFSYWMIDSNAERVGNVTTVRYSDFVNGSLVVKNLTPGRYVVEELDNTTGYTRTTTVKVNSGDTSEGTSANAVVEFGKITTVTFTNTYGEISSIRITKTIDGPLKFSLSDDQKKAISFIITDNSGKKVKEFTYYDMTDGYMVIENLQPGQYIITETVSDPNEELFGDYSCITQYKVGSAAAAQGNSVTMTAVHGENNVDFINTFNKIEPLKVVKSSSHSRVGLVDKNGVLYPVWRFTLSISNLNTLTTRNGTTTFTDVYDKTSANLFRLATQEEIASILGDQAKNYSISSLVEGKKAPNARFVEDNNQIIITDITDDTADKCNFTYYLIVKDQDALNEINTPDTSSGDGINRNFTNVVTYHPMPNKTDETSVTADYFYKFTAVSKGITNLDEDNNLYDIIDGQKVMVNYADYSVKLNEDGVTIGNQPTITAIDTFSDNQTVIMSSIRTVPSDGVSYKLDNDAHTIEFVIPNGTPVSVYYRIEVAESDSLTAELKNDIELLGFIDSVDRTVNRTISGEGQGEIYSMKLIKVDALNYNLKLSGVTFSLYDGITNEKLTSGTTNRDGQIQFKYWGTTGSFKPDHNYFLIEDQAHSGYNLDQNKIWLRISKNDTPGIDNHGVHVLSNRSEMIITNEPVAATLAVNKDFNDWSKQNSFQFKLEPINGAPMPAAGGSMAVATKESPLAEFGLIRYDVSDSDFTDNHVVTYHYTIQEVIDTKDMADGILYDTAKHPVTVVISDMNHDGVREVTVTYGDNNDRSLTITNRYETVDVSAKKIWEDFNNQYSKRPVNITFQLLRDGKPIDSRIVTEKDNWSWTFTGLPKYEHNQPIIYTIDEVDSDEYIKEITGNAKNGFVITNTLRTYGDLVVEKTVAGNAGDNQKVFQFTVKLSDQTISGAYGEMEFQNGIAKFSLKHGESKTAKDLPNGIYYTVTEWDYSREGYVTMKSGNEGSIIGNDVVIAKFTNTRNAVGTLTITKTLSGNDTDSNKAFTFIITLNSDLSGTYSGVTFKNGVAEVQLKGGESKVIEGLPNRTGYVVEEKEANSDGYVTTAKGDTGTISELGASVAAFTNTRNTFGKLTVTKTVAGNAGDNRKDFGFTVVLSDKTISGTFGDMDFTDGIAAFTLKHGESKTAKNLPNGIQYTVTEIDYSDAGYVTTHTGDKGTIVGNDELTAAFTNTRNANGSLTIKKTLAGNDTDREKIFTFTITLDNKLSGIFSDVVFENGIATVQLKGGESKTIEGLPNRTGYAIDENNKNQDGYVTSYKDCIGKISETEPSVAEITNTRDTFGTLTVTKTVAGNAGDDDKKFSFIVELSDTAISGTRGDMNFVNGVASFTLKNGESKTADNLPNGVHYIVTETDYKEEGYITEKFGSEGLIIGNDNLTAAFTNTRNADGSLTIKKTLVGNDTDREKAFTFTITLGNKISGNFSGINFADGIAVIQLKGGESKTIEGLPNRCTYKVEEKEVNESGYITTYQGCVGTISETVPAVAEIINTRDTFGQLTVQKTVAGNAGDDQKAFGFTVSLSDTTISGTYGGMSFINGVANFTLKNGESITADNLPNGVHYRVEEADYTREGYITEKSGNEGNIVGNDKLTAAFTNTRNAEGSLTVKKTLAGNDTEREKLFTFTITLDSELSGTYSGVVFENGVAVIQLKGGESKTIEGLPNRTRFSVEEKNQNQDGYVTTYKDCLGVISETKPAAAEITNTRDTFGSLIVRKVVAGNAGDAQKDFKFTVTLSDTTISGTYGMMSFVNGTATFTLKDGEYIKAENLPNGVHYVVTETDYSEDGYITEKSGSEGNIVGNDTLTAAFTNTRNAEGSLTITKTLAGNDTESDKLFTFIITLDAEFSGTYSGVVFENGVAVIQLKDRESKTIEGLPNRTGYKVEEKEADQNGYITTKKGDVGTISELAVSVAAFTNTRDTFGNLTISKTVEGNAGYRIEDYEFRIELSDKTISGTFGDISFVNGIADFSLKKDEKKTASGLPNGIKYTITERDYTEEGYITDMIGDMGTIVGNDTLKAEFVNTRNAEGSLTIFKKLAGNDTDKAKEFTFVITLDTAISDVFSDVVFENGTAVIKLKGGESKTIDGLPNGIGYKVEELEADEGGYETQKTGAVGTISELEVAVAAFTNTRNTYGDLSVSKTVSGNAVDWNKNFDFTITLSDKTISGTYGDMTFISGITSFTLKNGETKVAKGLPNGVRYLVAEADYTYMGYITTQNGAEGVIKGDDIMTSKFTNIRNAEGSLTITKNLAGNDTDRDQEFTFKITLDETIYGIYSNVVFESGTAVIKLKGGESKTIEGLPNGLQYTVTEVEANEGGYVTTHTGSTGTISEVAVSVAAFTNTRSSYGDLTVSKSVSGNAGDHSRDFRFTIELSDNTINGTYGDISFIGGTASFTLKDGESKTAVGLPNGTGYVVTEADYSDEGYVTTMSGNEGTIVGNDKLISSFINTRNAAGSLTVYKILSGNDVDFSKTFRFTITLDTAISGIFSDVLFENGIAEITLQGGESKTIEGLPNGTGYTVTEVEADTDGYTTTKKNNVGIISESESSLVTFVNTRDTFGSLTISKTLAGNAGDKAKSFEFRIELINNSISGTYGDVVFVDGIAEFTLKDGESKTAANLPNGVKYIVTEADYLDAGYITEMQGDTGVITGNETKTAKFINTRNAVGSLTISKTLEGNDADSTTEFTFAIALETNVNGVYSGVIFKNGEAVVRLKGGESKTIEGLPNGTRYIVAEREANTDGYITTKTGDTGTISEDKISVAAFTNTRNITPPDVPQYPGKPDEPKTPEDPRKPHDPSVPKTGDRGMQFLWFIILFVSSGAIVHRFLRRKEESAD